MVFDGANDPALAKVGANIVKIRCRPGQAARGMNQLYRISQVGVELRMFRVHANCRRMFHGLGPVIFQPLDALNTASNHRDELALHIGVAVDVPLSCLNGAVTGQQLDVTE